MPQEDETVWRLVAMPQEEDNAASQDPRVAQELAQRCLLQAARMTWRALQELGSRVEDGTMSAAQAADIANTQVWRLARILNICNQFDQTDELMRILDESLDALNERHPGLEL